MSSQWKAILGQLFLHLVLLLVVFIVIFPILWVVSMSLDPRNIDRPTELTLVPPGATLDAYIRVLKQPSPNPVAFHELFINSILVSVGTILFSIALAVTAAYAFSRFLFPGRQLGMLFFIFLQMMPAGATLAPLFVILQAVHLRTELLGLMIAYASGTLPFAIWNMKGFIDTIPKELEEAALIDGCSSTQTFLRIMMPLALPGLAVTALFGWMSGWTEVILAITFLEDPSKFTLSMVLYGMQGQYSTSTPWSDFAAFSILFTIPPLLVAFFLQRYIVAGLTVGGVKG